MRSITGHIHFSVPDIKCRKFVQGHGYGVYDAGRTGLAARRELTFCSEFEIVSQFNAELRGFANFYDRCARLYLNKVEWFWQNCLMRTLAAKWNNMQPAQVVKRLRQPNGRLALSYQDKKGRVRSLQVYSLSDRVKKDFYESVDLLPNTFVFGGRTELLDRIKARECEYCGKKGGYFQVHHVRKLKDIAGGKSGWEQLMIARQRKTLVLCRDCHIDLHRGKLPDQRVFRKSLEKPA